MKKNFSAVLHELGKLSKKKYREKSENGLLGGGVSDLFHFLKTLQL